MKERTKCENCAKITSWIGLISGVFLASFKIFVGFLGQSRALIASGMCNLSDISSALMVLVGVRYSKKSLNKRYPYGYGKIEFIAQISMSLLMIVGNITLLLSSFFVITRRVVIIPHIIVFFTAIISAIINGLIYKFANCGAKELNSPALKAHAEHNKIDVVSSLLVAVGVLGARIGLHWADPLIAVFECIHIIRGSYVIFWEGFRGIMDTSLPEKYINIIKEHLSEINEIKSVTGIKTRQAGQRIFLDMVIQLDSGLSVIDSKIIVQKLKTLIRKQEKRFINIFVQVVPATVCDTGE